MAEDIHPKAQVISASRRTDLPAFHWVWFMGALQRGWVSFLHPYRQRVIKVSLAPRDVAAFVFWSKNYANLITDLRELRRSYYFYCHFTITGLPRAIEPGVIPMEEAAQQFKALSHSLSPHHVLWRYDPIVITKDIGVDFHLLNFSRIASALEGHTHRCYLSFVSLYPKVLKGFHRAGMAPIELTLEEKMALVERFSEIAKRHGIALYACSSPELVSSEVSRGRCVDPELLGPISPKAMPSRKGCGCVESIDIGSYGTCRHGCIYCYAA